VSLRSLHGKPGLASDASKIRTTETVGDGHDQRAERHVERSDAIMKGNVSGFYHDPAVFLDEHPIDHAAKGETFAVHFDRFDKEVHRR
jgi:hypothetical protein